MIQVHFREHEGKVQVFIPLPNNSILCGSWAKTKVETLRALADVCEMFAESGLGDAWSDLAKTILDNLPGPRAA